MDNLENESALDSQVGGDHYKKLGEYQPWVVFSRWLSPEELKGYMKGTVIAYLAREQEKGGRVDISKAMHTIQLYLELTEGSVEQPTPLVYATPDYGMGQGVSPISTALREEI